MSATATPSRGHSKQCESLLLATVMGADHHVAVRWDVQTGRLRFIPTDPEVRSADRSSSSAGVVFLQVTYKGLPASAYAHHHMTLIQHLQRWHETGQSRSEMLGNTVCIYFLADVLPGCLWILNYMKNSLHTHTHTRTNLIFTSFSCMCCSGYERQMKLCQNLIKPNETTPHGASWAHTQD